MKIRRHKIHRIVGVWVEAMWKDFFLKPEYHGPKFKLSGFPKFMGDIMEVNLFTSFSYQSPPTKGEERYAKRLAIKLSKEKYNKWIQDQEGQLAAKVKKYKDLIALLK